MKFQKIKQIKTSASLNKIVLKIKKILNIKISLTYLSKNLIKIFLG